MGVDVSRRIVVVVGIDDYQRSLLYISDTLQLANSVTVDPVYETHLSTDRLQSLTISSKVLNTEVIVVGEASRNHRGGDPEHIKEIIVTGKVIFCWRSQPSRRISLVENSTELEKKVPEVHGGDLEGIKEIILAGQVIRRRRSQPSRRTRRGRKKCCRKSI